MEPTRKNPQIEQFLEANFGRTSSITSGVCIPPPVGCGKKIEGFRDEISEREYRISGLCQDCQDSVFGSDEEEEDDDH
jgi:hypothetical protein